MQVINQEVFRWASMNLVLGMVSVSLVVAGYSLRVLSGAARLLILLAALLCLVDCLGVTVAFNRPMNRALAGMDLKYENTRDFWLLTCLPCRTLSHSV